VEDTAGRAGQGGLAVVGIGELRRRLLPAQAMAGSRRRRLKAPSRTAVQGQLRCRRGIWRRPVLIMRPNGVQESIAELLGLPSAGLALQAEALVEDQQVLGGEHQLQPNLVGGEAPEGEVLEPGVLGAADPVLDPGRSAVAGLQRGQVTISLTGNEALKAVAVVVGEAELGTGWGRSRRQMTRLPKGQPPRSRSTNSQTAAPSRSSPSCLTAGTQALSGVARIASRTGSVRSKPTEKKTSNSCAACRRS
jgi:hypothetical protein